MTITRSNQDVEDASKISTDQMIASETLAAAVSKCFRMARDNRYPISQQGQFYASGVTLRVQLKALLGEIFEEGSDNLRDANDAIRQTNEQLNEALTQINRAAAAIEQLGQLVAQLTNLIKLAGIPV